MSITNLEREVLEMPAADRARLVQKVLISLENLPQDELDTLWLDEAERRAADIDSGKVVLVSADEVAHKARALLKK
ncbi:addiction module protein [Denitratimonas sp. CY0512]|uniref:addiction module protein n=1 Tax=Denitratimonas sp. CY0512 TaxID=3131940 RepID=UPI003097C333